MLWFLLAWVAFSLILLSSLDFTLAQVALKILPGKHHFYFCFGFGSALSSYILFHYLTFDKTARLWSISGFSLWHAVIYHSRWREVGELTSVLPSSWHLSYIKVILMCHIPGWYCSLTIKRYMGFSLTCLQFICFVPPSISP